MPRVAAVTVARGNETHLETGREVAVNLLRPIDEDLPTGGDLDIPVTRPPDELKVRVLRVHHAASCFDLIAEFVEVAFVLGVAHQRRVIAGKNDGSMVRALVVGSGATIPIPAVR